MSQAALDYVNSVQGAGVTSVTVSITPSASANLAIVQESHSGSGTVTGVTFGGNAMTLVPGSQSTTDNFETSVWYLVNPPTGSSQAAVISYSTFNGYVGVGVESYVNVNTSSPYAGVNTNGGSGAGPSSVSVTGAVVGQDLYIAHALFLATSGTDNQTNMWDQLNINSGAAAFGSQMAASGSGNFSWTWGGTQTDGWSAVGLVIKGIASTPQSYYLGTMAEF
jgi:hypothetical protein